MAPACTDSEPPATTSASASPIASSFPAPTTTTTTTTRPPPDLQSVVDAFVADQAVPFSVIVLDLSTGARASHLGDRRVRSASLFKLYVARELVRRFHAGTLRRDAAAGDGSGRTIEECLHAMIVVSDNDCGFAGLRVVGGGALNAGLHRDGFVSTSLSSPQQTSADDTARFFEQAHDGTLLGPDGKEASRELYDLLRLQEVNDRLPQGLPSGTPIAHKTGDIRQWAHDAGVITTPRGDVVLVVLSGPWPLPCCDADHPGTAERIAFGAIADLGRAVYDAVA